MAIAICDTLLTRGNPMDLRLHTATVYSGATKRRDLQVMLDPKHVAIAQVQEGAERDTVMLVVLNKINWQPGTLQWDHIRLTPLPHIGFSN